jgi:hypothetical protein
MQSNNSNPTVCAGMTCVLAIVSLAGTVNAQVSRQWVQTTAGGSALLQQDRNLSANRHSTPTPEAQGELWRFTDPVSIVNRVSVAGSAGDVWASFNLNNERLGHFALNGTGTPDFTFNVRVANPRLVAAVGAEDTSMCLMLTEASEGVKVRAFTAAGGSTPAWTYDFPLSYTFVGVRSVDVSDDGTIGIAAAMDPVLGESQVVVFDATNGTLLNRVTMPLRVQGVELSRDGSRAVFTEGGTAEVVEVPSLNTLTTLTASGAGGWQRLSGDGKTVAAGGFNCLVSQETSPGVWTPLLSFTDAGNWFGNGMALSDDGSVFFVTSHNYATGYLELTYRVFDTATGAITAQTSTRGTGQQQDSVQVARASADGSIFACASWGTFDNVHPEVQVFDASLNRIGGIDSDGSAFDMSMSRDGRYIASGTKSAHANTFGNGGDVIVIDMGGGCYADCDTSTGAGILDIFDFLCFQDSFVAGDPYACDCDTTTGPLVCDIFDFLCFQNAFVAGCP